MTRIEPGRPNRRWYAALLLLAVLLLLTACAQDAPPDAAAGPSVTPTASQQPAAATTPAPTADPGPITLRWWTPGFISPDPAQPGGALLDRALADFTATRQGQVRVQVEPKARYGKGGLLDYLRTAQPVAPGILPDIVTLDIAELEQAVALGVLRPLDGILDPAVAAQLYPFGGVVGQFNGQSVAMPIAVDIEHTMYDGRQRTASPATWAGLLAEDTPYIFPLGSPPSSSRATVVAGPQPVVLSHYLGAGATLDPATRQLSLEEDPLLRQLTFYDEAQGQGLLAPDPAELTTLQDALESVPPGTSAVVQTSARAFIARADTLQDWLPAAIPGWAEPSPSVVNGWALAIVTPDPERQRLAAELIAWLLAPERNGPWTQAAGWLPVSPGALNAWEIAPYRTFLDVRLAAAVAPPAGAESAAAEARLQKAVLAVVEGEVAPQEAVRQALGAAE